MQPEPEETRTCAFCGTAQPVSKLTGSVDRPVCGGCRQAAQPEERRVCAFCHTPQPMSQLAQVATWLECADTAACAQRAARSDLYSQPEGELSLAQFETASGALR